MAYEVLPGPIRRSRRSLFVPPLIALAVVAAALMSGPAPAARPAPTDAPPPPGTPAPLAAGLTNCREVRPLTCRDTVRAAQLALDSNYPPITGATAQRSLICGNDSDCPRGMLDGARPAGGVVFTFADETVAWVNVLWVDVSSRRFEDGTERLSAYVVRWFAPRT